jgi:hypothetical protein
MAARETVAEAPPTPLATPLSAMAPMSARSVRWGDLEDAAGGLERPLLRQRGANTTSQMAVVGANVCPIESLDYEYAPSISNCLLDLVLLVVHHLNFQ